MKPIAFLLGFGLVAGHAPLALAQVAGVPLRIAAPGGTGISAGFDLGIASLDADGVVAKQTLVTPSVNLTFGLGPLGVSASASRFGLERTDRDTRHGISVGGAGRIRVIGGPLIPLSIAIQAGATLMPPRASPPNLVQLSTAAAAAASGQDEREWRGHLGLGAALSIPNPFFAIRPWLLPRIEYLGREVSGFKRVRGALSAGVDLGLLNGIGVRFGYDSKTITDDPTVAPSSISFGLSYAFR